MNFQIRSDMSCTSTRKKQQPLSLTDGDGRSGNHYYTVTRTNVNLLCWQHIQLFASTLSPLPNLFLFSTALPSAVMSWPWHDQGRMAPKGFLRGCWAPSSQRMLWRPGRQEGAFEKGSQPVHGNIQNGMEVIFKHVKKINIKDPIWAKFLCMPCMLAQDIRNYVYLDRHGGACWHSICGCFLMHSCRGLPYKKANRNAILPVAWWMGPKESRGQDGKEYLVCPIIL